MRSTKKSNRRIMQEDRSPLHGLMRPVRQLIRERREMRVKKSLVEDNDDKNDDEEESIMQRIKPRWIPVFHDRVADDNTFSPRLSKSQCLRPHKSVISRPTKASLLKRQHPRKKKKTDKDKKKKTKRVPFIEPGTTRTMRLRERAQIERKSRETQDREIINKKMKAIV